MGAPLNYSREDKEGIERRFIQEHLWHSSIKATMIYTHITPTAVKKIVSLLDNLATGNFGIKKIENKH